MERFIIPQSIVCTRPYFVFILFHGIITIAFTGSVEWLPLYKASVVWDTDRLHIIIISQGTETTHFTS